MNPCKHEMNDLKKIYISVTYARTFYYILLPEKFTVTSHNHKIYLVEIATLACNVWKFKSKTIWNRYVVYWTFLPAKNDLSRNSITWIESFYAKVCVMYIVVVKLSHLPHIFVQIYGNHLLCHAIIATNSS